MATVKGATLRALEGSTGPALLPVDHGAVLDQRVWLYAVAVDEPQRIDVGGGLDRDGDEEGRQRVRRQVQVARQHLGAAMASYLSAEPVMLLHVRARDDHAAAGFVNLPQQGTMRVCFVVLTSREEASPLLEGCTGRVDLLVAGVKYRLQLRRRELTRIALHRMPAGEGVVGERRPLRHQLGMPAGGPLRQPLDVLEAIVPDPDRTGLPSPRLLGVEPQHITAEQLRGEVLDADNPALLGQEAREHLQRLPAVDAGVSGQRRVVAAEGRGEDHGHVAGKVQLTKVEALRELAPGIMEHRNRPLDREGRWGRLPSEPAVDAGPVKPHGRPRPRTDTRWCRRPRLHAARRSAGRLRSSGSRRDRGVPAAPSAD